MTKFEFFHSTPNDLKTIIESRQKRQKFQSDMIEYNAWATGVYVRAAINCAFSKHAKFPDCPVSGEKKTIKEIAESNGKTEEELQQELRFMTLCVEKANMEIDKARRNKVGRQGG